MWQSVIKGIVSRPQLRRNSIRWSRHLPCFEYPRLGRWTRHERRPIDGPLKLRIGLESRFESEAELRGPMLLKMGQPFRRFVHTGTMPGRNPPQGGVRARKSLEPRFPLTKEFCVRRLVNVMPQRRNALPNGHVDQDPVVLRVRSKVSRVTDGRL